jgi:hypothetical protein
MHRFFSAVTWCSGKSDPGNGEQNSQGNHVASEIQVRGQEHETPNPQETSIDRKSTQTCNFMIIGALNAAHGLIMVVDRQILIKTEWLEVL